MYTHENLTRPIIIVSAGRSGSTMYYRMVARHRDLGWLSSYNQALPSLPSVALLSRLYGTEILDGVKHETWFPKPFSPYRFWARYLPDIARHDRPLVADDVADAVIDPLRRTISRIVRYQGRTRFLMKLTGWSRIAYFDRIFPDARFIYLRRDPLSVVESWVRAGWLNVTDSVDSDGWEWGAVPREYREVWDDLGGGSLLSAAMKTQLDMDDIRRNVDMFPGRCFELNYEDLISDPMTWMRNTLEFCELEWDAEMERVVESTIVHNFSKRWSENMSDDDGHRVREFFGRIHHLSAA